MTNIIPSLEQARQASKELLLLGDSKINKVILALADSVEINVETIIDANKKDLARMDKSDPKYDRLLLNKQRISDIASDIRSVASLTSPFNQVLESYTRPNGMKITKLSVPFGVIGAIYEARPNVSLDVFTLCFKAGNVSVLKGGSDADASNKAIVSVIHSVLKDHGISESVCTLLPADREATAQLLSAVGYVDLLIPRGSSSLINYVRENAAIPVIETGAGICHCYFDKYGDTGIGAAIINNAKTRRVSVCNSLDCLVIHEKRISDLPALCGKLAQSNVIIYADQSAFNVLNGHYPSELLQHSDEDSYGTEFLDYKLAIKTVCSMTEALEHIAKYSSKHSETIITEDESRKERFRILVDAACVYTNVSTAFTDGGQFGFGAEIGISTQKLHARGPMALREITSYKYIIDGNGQIR